MVLSVFSSVECAGVCECVGGRWDFLPVLLCVHMFVFLNILNSLERKSPVVSFYYAVLPIVCGRAYVDNPSWQDPVSFP